MGSQRRIDDAIDRAVREMLAIEPRADLRARVLARLERPRGWLTASRLAATAALAATALVGLFWSRPAPSPAPDRPPAPTAVARTVPVPAPPVQTPPVREAVRQPTAAPAPRTSRGSARPDAARVPAPGRIVAASLVESPIVDPRSADGAADAAPPLPGTPAIEIPSIEIPPLSIERIVIVPIPPPR
jgi:hypothetical protein